MTHPHDDQLLLLAYGDLEEPATVELERHLAGCAPCRDRLLIAGVLLAARPSAHDQQSGWAPPLEWSATAGYVAGGKAVITIDAQLTRLEQGWSYGRP